MEPDSKKLMYSLKSVVAATEVSRTRLFEDISTGQLESFKVGRRRYVTADALDAYIAKLRRDALSDRYAQSGDEASEGAREVHGTSGRRER